LIIPVLPQIDADASSERLIELRQLRCALAKARFSIDDAGVGEPIQAGAATVHHASITTTHQSASRNV